MKTSAIRPIAFEGGRLFVLDQTLLPGEERHIELKSVEDVREAIRSLRVRGAPAIGLAAAYGVCLAARASRARDVEGFCRELSEARERLAGSRPTAVNLFQALGRMVARLSRLAEGAGGGGWADMFERLNEGLLLEAESIRAEGEAACLAMGELGLGLLKPGMGLLTHCNAGALAAPGIGTALAPVYLGQERGYGFRVFADETRPLLQGARLTAWELMRAGVDVTLICDGMAAAAMREGLVDAVLTGCDRLARNGDGANKIGTAGLAALAKAYGLPFYMFVPTSTIDMAAATGGDIPIELRDGGEICELWYGRRMAPEGVKTWNPAFDVTEHGLITAIVTEKGVARPPFDRGIAELMGAG
ncbi:MAG: S-methyl-5-thioribose-1-phosphate isomerase [Clostridiales Family XIII bacterium]|jgi:methylthioribose-1-phosphate isomerase|nr:S-methyl-5-thioribose-1-phosphate isomerase [Clostridiales Family XIII bacterium]